MTTLLKEAAQQALEAMEYSGMDVGKFNRINAACRAIRVALAEPPTNQCGETCERAKLCAACARELEDHADELTVAYMMGAQSRLRTLTDEVIAELWYKNGTHYHHFARAIERWIKGTDKD